MIFEHTDGLNGANLSLRYLDVVKEGNKISLSWTAGVDLVAYIPKTNSTLWRTDRYDDFHLSGYGVNTVGGLQVMFWDRVFVQSEAKLAFVNLPDIRISPDKSEFARPVIRFYSNQYRIWRTFSSEVMAEMKG